MAQFSASVTAQKNKNISVRVFDPLQNKWWTGTVWTTAEASGQLLPLTVTTLNNIYENRYTRTLTIPDVGGPYTIEYIDLSNSVCIAEESTNINTVLTRLTSERSLLFDRLLFLDTYISSAVEGKVYIPTLTGHSNTSGITNNPDGSQTISYGDGSQLVIKR
jgi:hypothetical protein